MTTKRLNFLLVTVLAFITTLTECSKKDDSPSPTTSTSTNGSATSVSSGSLTFQGQTYKLSGGCSTSNNSYNIGGASSAYGVAIEFPNGKPTANTSINFPSSDVQISNTQGSSIWTPISGTATVSVSQDTVVVSFSNANFSNGKSTALATATVTCQ